MFFSVGMNGLTLIQFYTDEFFFVFFAVNQPVVVTPEVAFLLETLTNLQNFNYWLQNQKLK